MTGTHDPNVLREQLLRDSSGGECLSLAHVDYVAGLMTPRLVGCSSETVDGHGSIVDRRRADGDRKHRG